MSCDPMYMLTASDPAEGYIKNKIETHEQGKFSDIKIYSLCYITATNGTGSLVFTGYKYGTLKGLMVGALPPAPLPGAVAKPADDNAFIELTVQECQSIIDNYKILQDKLKLEKAVPFEAVYQDFTVTSKLFISYKGTTYYGKVAPTPISIDCWVNGEKFTLPSTDNLINHLKTFVAY